MRALYISVDIYEFYLFNYSMFLFFVLNLSHICDMFMAYIGHEEVLEEGTLRSRQR